MPGSKVLVVRSTVPPPQSTIKNDANVKKVWCYDSHDIIFING